MATPLVVPMSLAKRLLTTEPAYLSLGNIDYWQPEGKRREVSVVARAPTGFMGQYRRAGGDPNNLDDYWRDRRWNFVKRHMMQAAINREKLIDEHGRYSDRHLALIFWAYTPLYDLGRKP